MDSKSFGRTIWTHVKLGYKEWLMRLRKPFLKYINIMNELRYESIPLNLLIKNYEPIQFTLGEYAYSDKYTPPKGNQSHGSYILCISTGEMTEQGQLSGASIRLMEHAELVKMILKYVTGACLFHSEDAFDLKRKKFLVSGMCANGWKSNYEELNKVLDHNPIRIKLCNEPSRPYSQIPLSPLHELQIVLK